MFQLTQNKWLSLGISVLFWTVLLGSVQLALGMLVLIAVHEFGHFFAGKYRGLRVTQPMFTPFGAAVGFIDPPRSASEEAFTAFAGPLFGGAAGVATLALGVHMGVSELILLGQYALFLNLINLLPFAPLDGGRISMAIHRKLWIPGLGLLGVAVYFIGWGLFLNPFNLLIAFLIGTEAVKDVQWREIQAAQNPAYFAVPLRTRLGYIAAYVLLGAFLVYGVFHTSALVALLSGAGL